VVEGTNDKYNIEIDMSGVNQNSEALLLSKIDYIETDTVYNVTICGYF